MAPVYMVTVFFYAYVLENAGDGPMWKERIGRETEKCRASWWANLLYLNNYINLDKIVSKNIAHMHHTRLNVVCSIANLRELNSFTLKDFSPKFSDR